MHPTPIPLESPIMRPMPVLPPPGTATYADLEALPEGLVGELIDGTLFATPRPAIPHAVVGSVLGHRLGPAFHRKGGENGLGGWWILNEPELHLGGNVLVPDLAGWRRERLPSVPTGAAFTLAPDWVCEVLSPSTMRLDRNLKLERYRRQGVAHAWLVDPIAGTLEVFRAETGGWLLIGNHHRGEVVNAEPFAVLTLALAEVWDS